MHSFVARLRRFGKSLVVTIPRDVVRELNLKGGETLLIRACHYGLCWTRKARVYKLGRKEYPSFAVVVPKKLVMRAMLMVGDTVTVYIVDVLSRGEKHGE